MTPPRALPSGHFVGDGHNHGRAAGESVRSHSCDHAHENPEQHLRHLQQHQQARGRTTLQEFQQAAQETRALMQGQPSKEARPEPGASSARPRASTNPNSPSERQAESRHPSGSEPSGSHSAGGRIPSREVSAWARLFSSASLPLPGAKAWTEAGRSAASHARSGEAASQRSAGEAGSSLKGMPELGASRSAGEPRAQAALSKPMDPSAALLRAVEKLQVAWQAAARASVGEGTARLPPEAAAALGLLLREASVSPQLLASLPPSLKSLVQTMMGPAGSLLPQLFPKLLAAGLGPALQACLAPGVVPVGALAAGSIGPSAPLRSLGLLLGAPLFAAAPSAKFSPSLLQRLEKALLQFFQLLSAKPGSKPAQETALIDKALLEQLAALVAAEERRRKEREQAKKKAEVSAAPRAKGDSDFSEDEAERELWEDELFLSYG